MGNGLNQEQMLAARRKKLQKSGIPANAGMMNSQSMVNNSSSGSAMSKIAAIKSGAMQQDFAKFDNATGKDAPGPGGAASFQGIPEVKQRSRKGGPVGEKVSDPKFSQQLAKFDTPGAGQASGELASIERMFGGESNSRPMPGMPQQGSMNTNLDLDTTLAGVPSFNPRAALSRANSEAMQQGAETQGEQGGFDYAQYALGKTAEGTPTQEMMGEQTRAQQSNSFNYQKEMMQTIAEQTVRSILKEFTENQKDGKTFTNYKNQKNIIKTADGNIYQLTPLREGADGKLYKSKKK